MEKQDWTRGHHTFSGIQLK